MVMVYSTKGDKGNPHAITYKIRYQRVHKRISGTPECPRLMVTRSNHHMVAQVVDDTTGHTLCITSTLEKAAKGVEGHEVGIAHKVGELTAERARALDIEAVMFNHGGSKYYGHVTAVTEGAHEGGPKL